MLKLLEPPKSPMSASKVNNNQYDNQEEVERLRIKREKYKVKVKKWGKLLETLMIPHVSSSYYNHLPIKPGVKIYKAIVESKYPISKLGVKIPETLAAFEDLYWIAFDYTKGKSYFMDVEQWASTPTINERKDIKPGFKPKGFVDYLEYIDIMYYRHIEIDKAVDPAVVQRNWVSYPATDNIDVYTWEKLRYNYSFGPNADGVLQRFIYSPTHKATLYRLIFFNPNNSNERSSYGFCLTNKKNYWTPKADIENRCLHISESVNSYNVYNLNGKSIKELEEYAFNLCVYLERSYAIKIETIVCDFTKDELGNFFFSNVKSFKLVYAQIFSEIAAMSEQEKIARHHEIKERKQKSNNTVQCQLCRINFRNSDITKIASMKMLFTLKQHLNKRGIFKFEYLERFRGYQLSCRVCDICYQLVVAEHELIEVEKLFAKCCNIPYIEDSEPVQKKPNGYIDQISKDMESKKISSDRFKEKLLQWRLLFFIKELKDKTLHELASELKSDQMFLQIKLFDFITSMEIFNKSKPSSNESPKKTK